MKSLLRWLRDEHYAQRDWTYATQLRCKIVMFSAVLPAVPLTSANIPLPQAVAYLLLYIFLMYLVVGVLRRRERQPIDVPPQLRQFWAMPWWQRLWTNLRSSVATQRQRRALYIAAACFPGIPLSEVFFGGVFAPIMIAAIGVSAIIYCCWIMPVPGHRNLN